MPSDLFRNDALIAALLAWLLAQFLKVLTHRYSSGKLDFRMWTSSGGMPSSHSAFVTALSTTIGWLQGLDSPLFATTIVFGSIVMYDASGVRRAASEQARILNHIVEELFAGQPISERRLKELLGHTPLQVIVGGLLGVAVAVVWMGLRAAP
jgi:acid phosphatase family membrane protein YuiD